MIDAREQCNVYFSKMVLTHVCLLPDAIIAVYNRIINNNIVLIGNNLVSFV